MKKIIILARASSGKQVVQGDTLDDQIARCKAFCEKKGWQIIKTFPLVESGRTKERQFFEGVLKFCTDKKNKVDLILFIDIDRFTRGGGVDLVKWKQKLAASNVYLQDLAETFRQPINTMEDLDLEYSWSNYNPSEVEEFRRAEQAKQEITTILTRMIRSEVKNTRAGFWQHSPPYGYDTKKVEIEGKKKTILVPRDKEATYLKKMFELRASGQQTDQEIVETLNNLGFKTRKRYLRDKQTKKIIGQQGEKLLTVKQLQRLIMKPIYAGVILEKWTKYQPVKAKFEGLVSLDMFNKANRGKVVLEQLESDKIAIFYDQPTTFRKGEPIREKRQRKNSRFPFKNVIKCSECANLEVNKTFMASSSRGKSGELFGYYHCGGKKYHKTRPHSYLAIPEGDFHKTIDKFLDEVRFADSFIDLFEEIFMRKFRLKTKAKIQERSLTEEHIKSLTQKQEELLESLDDLSRFSSELVKKKFVARTETKIEKLETEIKQARKQRNKQELAEDKLKQYLKSARFLLEHPKEMLIDRDNVLKIEQVFGLFFDELPTYKELVTRTPKLAPLFKLKQDVANNPGKISESAGTRTRDAQLKRLSL